MRAHFGVYLAAGTMMLVMIRAYVELGDISLARVIGGNRSGGSDKRHREAEEEEQRREPAAIRNTHAPSIT
ncbi:MAG TPA: hypothetical protein VK009_24100 [Chloroflexota bacterium]|nr:hypothetical protein [Chloroflexota bacterium]